LLKERPAVTRSITTSVDCFQQKVMRNTSRVRFLSLPKQIGRRYAKLSRTPSAGFGRRFNTDSPRPVGHGSPTPATTEESWWGNEDEY
jgi:hypothetical protein